MIYAAVNFDLGQVANPTTIVGVLVFAAGFVLLWRRDVNNPEKAASTSIVSEAVGYSAQVMEVANQASLMAQAANVRAEEAHKRAAEANRRAEEAAEANIQCARKFALLIEHTSVLTRQLVTNGITPRPMPDDLLG